MAIRDTARRKLTYEDYVLFPEDGQRHEIIDGEHYVSPAPTPKHQRVSMRLSSRLHVFAEEHRLGEVLPAPTDVLLSRHDVLQPDILFISKPFTSEELCAKVASVLRRGEHPTDS